MRQSSRYAILPIMFAAAALLSACQSPTDSSDTLEVDDFVDSSVTPSTATAAASTDGRTYRVVRGNNQADDIFAYDFKTTFRVTVTVNKNAADDDVDLSFPVTITSISAKVEQASGGIVTPPTGSDSEHYESVLTQSTGSTFSGTNASVSFNEDVWYSLPSKGKEALITITISFKDDDSKTFTKTVKVLVNP
jgi:hypothetical protein